ncbi:DUF7638 domain-containing protein [Actinoplanes regularis]|uniref:DUF7638 domain-containing protein n=1 Tax=Actinoplanes regularis TaxID=52697 RepID=UPI003D7FB4D3
MVNKSRAAGGRFIRNGPTYFLTDLLIFADGTLECRDRADLDEYDRSWSRDGLPRISNRICKLRLTTSRAGASTSRRCGRQPRISSERSPTRSIDRGYGSNAPGTRSTNSASMPRPPVIQAGVVGML